MNCAETPSRNRIPSFLCSLQTGQTLPQAGGWRTVQSPVSPVGSTLTLQPRPRHKTVSCLNCNEAQDGLMRGNCSVVCNYTRTAMCASVPVCQPLSSNCLSVRTLDGEAIMTMFLLGFFS